tara:strand:- start:3384 stop:3983 length:600 start_codon:yes stop_codon:yes gene_type:complete
MAEKSNQNWEQRIIDSRGPKFRLDVNNPQMGADGPNTYLMYAVTDNKDKQFSALSESGTYRLHNERTIEVVAGSKNSGSDTSVKISSVEGDITITVMGNGQVRIAGGNVVVQADEDINLKAGRNISLNAASSITLNAIKVQARGLIGNLVKNSVGTFLQRVFSGSYVGEDYLKNPPSGDKFLSKPAVPGTGDVPDIGGS